MSTALACKSWRPAEQASRKPSQGERQLKRQRLSLPRSRLRPSLKSAERPAGVRLRMESPEPARGAQASSASHLARGVGVKRVVKTVEPRSEEHTSELQSLR